MQILTKAREKVFTRYHYGIISNDIHQDEPEKDDDDEEDDEEEDDDDLFEEEVL